MWKQKLKIQYNLRFPETEKYLSKKPDKTCVVLVDENYKTLVKEIKKI